MQCNKLIVLGVVNLSLGLSSCGDKNTAADKSLQGPVEVEFDFPIYKPVNLTLENAESIANNTVYELSTVISQMTKILRDKRELNLADYSDEKSVDGTADISDTICKFGGYGEFFSTGSYLSNGSGMSINKEGYRSDYKLERCASQYVFEGQFLHGDRTIEVQEGLVMLSHAPYDVFWFADGSKASYEADGMMTVNEDGSIPRYLSGRLEYDLISTSQIGISQLNYYFKDVHLDVSQGSPTFEYFLHDATFSVEQIDQSKYRISSASSNSFEYGSSHLGSKFRVTITEPIEAEGTFGGELTAGGLLLKSQQGVLSIELHPSHYTYSLDAQADGDFEITETVLR